MATTHTLLQKITVGPTSVATVIFSNIPQTYTDLMVKTSTRGAGTVNSSEVSISFNGVTTNLSSKILYGTGTTVGSSSLTTIPGVGTAASDLANTYGYSEFYIPNYTWANNKHVLVDGVAENSGTTAYQYTTSGYWASSAAITSITLTNAQGNFVQNSTFYLYGVSNAGTTALAAPKALGGDFIRYDGTNWYHAFTSSGTFTSTAQLTCDILQIAGGGSGCTGGGYQGEGGGGAGGVLYSPTQNIASGVYTVLVGAGGSITNTSNAGTYGNNSSFYGLTAIGGGAGGGGDGGAGGSGGGGGSQPQGTAGGNGGLGTSGQGNNGGHGYWSGSFGAGGGGAGAAGTNASSGVATAGGVGTSTYSSWGSLFVLGQNSSGTYYFAGGGGGGIQSGSAGAGGIGGGGAGGSGANGTAGSANTGGGGGGAGDSGATARLGGAGGSGVVIIRYAG